MQTAAITVGKGLNFGLARLHRHEEEWAVAMHGAQTDQDAPKDAVRTNIRMQGAVPPWFFRGDEWG